MSQQQGAPARPLYDEVERIRLRNGWTKTQLARNAGVSRNTIENWKSQPRTPLAPTIKDVAEKLGIHPEMALRLAGIIPMDTPTPREYLADAIQRRLDELGLDWDEAIPRRADVRRYPVENLAARDKRRAEDRLRWSPGSFDEIIAGGEPTPRADRYVYDTDSAHAEETAIVEREPTLSEIREDIARMNEKSERVRAENAELGRQLQQVIRELREEREAREAAERRRRERDAG